MPRIQMIEDQSSVGVQPMFDSSTGMLYTLAGAAVTVTGITSGLAFVRNWSDVTCWVRWDGSAAAPVTGDADGNACPSFPLIKGESYWFPATATGTLSLYGTGNIFVMGAKVA